MINSIRKHSTRIFYSADIRGFLGLLLIGFVAVLMLIPVLMIAGVIDISGAAQVAAGGFIPFAIGGIALTIALVFSEDL